jgi:hypothetical protein
MQRVQNWDEQSKPMQGQRERRTLVLCKDLVRRPALERERGGYAPTQVAVQAACMSLPRFLGVLQGALTVLNVERSAMLALLAHDTENMHGRTHTTLKTCMAARTTTFP